MLYFTQNRVSGNRKTHISWTMGLRLDTIKTQNNLDISPTFGLFLYLANEKNLPLFE